MSRKTQFWNPWHGCTKCSAGCQNCYMYYLDEQRGVTTPSNVCHKTNGFNLPLQKERSTKEYKIKSGEKIRVNMTSDTFIEEADEWRDEMWNIIRQRSDVVFWLLTKRPERIADHLPDDWGDGWENVVLNVTCENQEMFDKRIQCFLDVPAKHKGLCLAPLLSDIDIRPALMSGQIEDVSAGGENYNNPRPCQYEWVKNIADTCREFRVNFCWYETGTRLWVNDQYYEIEDKQSQSVEAWFAGLNQRYYEPQYKLKYPDGTPVPQKDIYERKYNLHRCIFCSNQDICNGCVDCGNCKKVTLLNRTEFLEQQEEYLKQKKLSMQ